jgi:hypothetical protein
MKKTPTTTPATPSAATALSDSPSQTSAPSEASSGPVPRATG